MSDEYEAIDPSLSCLFGMDVGDRVTIHEPECTIWDEDECSCTPIVVMGPSAQA